MKKKMLLAITSIIVSLVTLSGCTLEQAKTVLTETNEALAKTENDYFPKESGIETPEWDMERVPQDLAEIMQTGVLVVGMRECEDNIFAYHNEDGSYSGIDINIAKDIAKSLGVTLKIKRDYATVNDMIPDLMDHKIDLIISNMTISPERVCYIYASSPYVQSKYSLMLNKSKLVRYEIENNPLDFLRNHKTNIGVPMGSVYVNIVKEHFPKANVIEMDSREELIQQVKEGKLSGYFEDTAMHMYFYAKDPELSLKTKVFEFDDTSDDICIGIALDRPSLLEFVNAYVNTTNTITESEINSMCKAIFAGGEND